MEDRARRAAEALAAGDLAVAEREFLEILSTRPDDAEAWNDLGIVRQAKGEIEPARDAFERALLLRPGLAAPSLNLGHLSFETDRDFSAAEAHYRAALEKDPALDEARRKLALALYELGRVEDAMLLLDSLAGRQPEDDEALECRLFFRNALPQHDGPAHFEEHRTWGRGRSARRADAAPRRARGRLRIGYVSADFRTHAMAPFILPLLEGHDRTRLEVFCYANQRESDATTDRMKNAATAWRVIHAMDGEAAAQLVRADRPDVLVDLSGHSRGNRLDVFARRPARVQMTYMGYLNTTGLEAMDYRISDSLQDPPGASDRLHSERLLRIDPLSWCYMPPPEAPGITPAPGERSGFPTFGSFNHPAKLNGEVLRLWATLLLASPGARLVIGAMPSAGTADRIAARLMESGIAPHRLEFLSRLGRKEYLDAVARVDVGLDPFPYCGGSTTCDMLWMGVPVVTLAGDFGFARSCSAILHGAGLGDCVASTPRDYIDKAMRVAEPEVLAPLRASLRDRLRRSVLMDQAAFVRRMEGAYCRAAAREAPC